MQVLVGDLLQSNAQTLINTVNCVGVMGKGIALEFKKQFPEMFEDYVRRCKAGEVLPGVPYLYREVFPPQILNFPTKDHWKSVSRLEDIELGLKHLVANYKAWEISSLAVPPLGCGNGQLEWRVVGPLIYRYLRSLDIPVQLYAPFGTPPRELSLSFLEQAPEEGGRIVRATQARDTRGGLNPAWIALVEIVDRLDTQPYCGPVGRTIFQKIAFVATREGLPTGLQHARGSFGPFSDGLKTVQTRLVNDNLLQEQRLGNMFKVSAGPNFRRVRPEYETAFQPWAGIIEKTVDLFARVNTNQAEIIATVLFSADALAQQLKRFPTEGQVLDSVMEWKARRNPPLSEGEVASAIRNLAVLRWLAVEFDPALPVPREEAI